MTHTYSALGALAFVSVLALQSQKSRAYHVRLAIERDIETQMTTLATGLLDDAEALPVSSTLLPVASGSHPGEAHRTLALADSSFLNRPAQPGETQIIPVPGPHGQIPIKVHVSVEPVEKQGLRFVPTTDETPYQRAVVSLRGPMNLAVQMERLFTYTH